MFTKPTDGWKRGREQHSRAKTKDGTPRLRMEEEASASASTMAFLCIKKKKT